MRLIAVLLATLALTNVMAQTNAPDSFCVKYAKIVFNKNATTLTGTDEYNLISAVVARVVVGCDNNAANQFGVTANLTGTIFANYAKQACGNNGVTKVNGLVSDPLNAPFFAGTAPNYNSQTGLQTLNTNAGIPLNATFPSIRFVGVNGQSVTPNPASVGDGKGAEGLIQHLVSFFGNAFGCSFYNSTLNTPTTFPPSFIGKYNGIGNMAVVHQNMNITKPVWDEFVNTFTQSLASFGVPTADIQSMVGPIVNLFLLGSGTNQICNDKATCACANIGGINGTPATNVNGTCVANAVATTAPPTATTAPPTSTTSPPTTHSSASTVAISAATIFGAVLLAFL